MLLGVNIDHIAVLREARKIHDPNPLDALGVCKLAGADQITIHLREDRRHIHDEDAKRIIELSPLPVNLECSINDAIIDIVCELKPHRATLVPENREEVTTEGGLDVKGNYEQIKKTIQRLKEDEIEISLFIDPDNDIIKLCEELEVDWVELHTGHFANIHSMLFGGLANTHHSIKDLELSRKELSVKLNREVSKIEEAAEFAAVDCDLKVAAGHGLNYQNIKLICDTPEILEYNIGQSIIARSIFTGLSDAVKDMKRLIIE